MLLQVPKFKNFILLLLLTCIGVVQAYADFQPPKIYPQTPAGHILVQAGQTAKLICRGTLKGVSWFLPTDASESLRRRLLLTSNTDHRYFESQIQIRDLNYTDTGTLVCAYNGTTDLTSIGMNVQLWCTFVTVLYTRWRFEIHITIILFAPQIRKTLFTFKPFSARLLSIWRFLTEK